MGYGPAPEDIVLGILFLIGVIWFIVKICIPAYEYQKEWNEKEKRWEEEKKERERQRMKTQRPWRDKEEWGEGMLHYKGWKDTLYGPVQDEDGTVTPWDLCIGFRSAMPCTIPCNRAVLPLQSVAVCFHWMRKYGLPLTAKPYIEEIKKYTERWEKKLDEIPDPEEVKALQKLWWEEWKANWYEKYMDLDPEEVQAIEKRIKALDEEVKQGEVR